MSVPSFTFLAFALGAAAIYNLPLGQAWRRLALLAANILFILSFSRAPLALAPFAGFLGLGYAALLLTGATRRPAIALPVAVMAILAIFVWLKKYSFVPTELLLQNPYLTVGLSYVFFRVMHLVVDYAQGAVETRPGVLDYINYTTNFLALVSGPIQRYEDYQAQQIRAEPPAPGDFLPIAERVLIGLFKVLVVSFVLIEQHKTAVAALEFDQALAARIVTLLQVVLLFPLYLYANFSGYCDVVIALARLFRLQLPENFDRPFTSGNFIDFWSRWHITLSSWLKTYVYSPLMMFSLRRVHSKGADAWVSAGALFVTFSLVGVWHGQTSEFLVFGLLQGGGVAVNKLYQVFMTARLGRKGYRRLAERPVYRDACRGFTFVWFAFSLLWFWSDWDELDLMVNAASPAAIALAVLLALVGCTLLLGAFTRFLEAMDRTRFSWKHARVASASVQLTALWAVTMILAAPAPEIVYKAF